MNQIVEYGDEYIVPRSSSIVVKRTPKIVGRSKRQQGNQGMAPPPARPPPPSYTLHAGPMSKRFDKEDGKSTNQATVSHFRLDYLSQIIPTLNQGCKQHDPGR
jgi:hypothetical protein